MLQMSWKGGHGGGLGSVSRGGTPKKLVAGRHGKKYDTGGFDWRCDRAPFIVILTVHSGGNRTI